MNPLAIAIIGSLIAGGGLVTLLAVLRPAPLRLSDTMAWLHTDTTPTAQATPALRWVKPPVKELRLLGRNVDSYLTGKLAWTGGGLLLPAVFSLLMNIAGVGVGFLIPTVLSLAGGVAGYVLYDANIRQHANAAREEMGRVVSVYLSTVALVRQTGAGPVESLERAAQVGDGWVFIRLREALADARARNIQPWTELRSLADELGVPELSDVGDIMRLAGDQGAQVADSLMTRSQSLRVQERTREKQASNQRTVLMYVPVTMILLVFIVLIGYPAALRILG